MTHSRKNTWFGALALVLASVAVAGAAHLLRGAPSTRSVAHAQARRDVPEDADRIVREMSTYLASLRAFRVQTDSATEVVLANGQRLQFVSDNHLLVRRPDRLRSERVGADADLVFYYDGRNVTLHGRRMNVWATAPAPATIDEMVDFARADLGLEAPAADLLSANSYSELMEDVRSATYVGEEMVNGVNTHHIAFRNRGGTDWQIWVSTGTTPLPMRYVIVSTDVRSQPEFTVSLHDWDTQPTVSDADFVFEAPAGAQQIEFRNVAEARQQRDRGRAQPRQRRAQPQQQPEGE